MANRPSYRPDGRIASTFATSRDELRQAFAGQGLLASVPEHRYQKRLALERSHHAAAGEVFRGIKSDHWIRRMAESHGMIEPFEPAGSPQPEWR